MGCKRDAACAGAVAKMANAKIRNFMIPPFAARICARGLCDRRMDWPSAADQTFLC
jgi:hypothetical protein